LKYLKKKLHLIFFFHHTFQLPINLILSVTFLTIIYFMANLNSGIDRYFICCAIIALLANISIAFGKLEIINLKTFTNFIILFNRRLDFSMYTFRHYSAESGRCSYGTIKYFWWFLFK
jgi:hypothetical protein